MDIRQQLAARQLQLKTTGVKYEIATKNGQLKEPGIGGRIYVRPKGGISDGGVVIKPVPVAIPLRAGINAILGEGREVWVKSDDSDRLYIEGNDYEDLIQAGINPSQLNQNDPSTRYRNLSLISDFQSFPTGGDGTVMVHGGWYQRSNGKPGRWAGQQEIDLLTSYKPATSTNQHIVALWFDQDTDAIAITTSSEISQSTDLRTNLAVADTLIAEAAVNAPARTLGSWTYIVNGDDTVISEENKFTGIRPFLSVYDRSGNAGYPNPVTYDFGIPSGNTLLVKNGWSISAGGSVRIPAGSAVCII